MAINIKNIKSDIANIFEALRFVYRSGKRLFVLRLCLIENGEELSMGQYQRIALARALFKDAPVLVLDEPASWQDAGSESRFFENLAGLKENKIILVISHSTNKVFEYKNIYLSEESYNNKHLILN